MKKNLALVFMLSLGCDRLRDAQPTGFQGVVEFEERRVSFEVGGRIARLTVRRGATLREGDEVSTLDPSGALPARDARRAEVEAARARVALLRAGSRASDIRAASAQVTALEAVEASIERSLARAQALARSGAGPTAPVEDLEGQRARAIAEHAAAEQRLRTVRQGARPQEVAAAEAQLRAAESGLAAEEQRLARFTARAPVSGVVLDVLAEPGDVVSPGAPVITLADTARPYVDVFVPQGGVGRVRLGAAARVRVDGAASALPARVEDIARQTEFTPRFLFSERERPNLVVRVRLRVDDPGRALRAGVPAFATIEGASP
ncbi:MAG: HlyD family efflux transporter periplasmic adaptor subunit [Polyangiales bacterium]